MYTTPSSVTVTALVLAQNQLLAQNGPKTGTGTAVVTCTVWEQLLALGLCAEIISETNA